MNIAAKPRKKPSNCCARAVGLSGCSMGRHQGILAASFVPADSRAFRIIRSLPADESLPEPVRERVGLKLDIRHVIRQAFLPFTSNSGNCASQPRNRPLTFTLLSLRTYLSLDSSPSSARNLLFPPISRHLHLGLFFASTIQKTHKHYRRLILRQSSIHHADLRQDSHRQDHHPRGRVI